MADVQISNYTPGHLNAWGKQDISKNQMPNTAKLLRLAFHDCAPYLAADGSTYGGIYHLSLLRILSPNITTL